MKSISSVGHGHNEPCKKILLNLHVYQANIYMLMAYIADYYYCI